MMTRTTHRWFPPNRLPSPARRPSVVRVRAPRSDVPDPRARARARASPPTARTSSPSRASRRPVHAFARRPANLPVAGGGASAVWANSTRVRRPTTSVAPSVIDPPRIGRSKRRSVGRNVGRNVGRSKRRSIDRSVGRSKRRSVDARARDRRRRRRPRRWARETTARARRERCRGRVRGDGARARW